MVDCMGGVHSPCFKNFEGYCKKIHEICLENTRAFIMLLHPTLCMTLDFDPVNFKNHIIKRFTPGSTKTESNNLIIETIRNHSKSTSTAEENILDFLYSWKQKLSF